VEQQAPIRIYLVDDQSMIRAGFRSLLGRDSRFQIVGDNGDPRAAVAAIAALEPDVVLLDISMPGLSGIDALEQIRNEHPRIKAVMLTHHEGEAFVAQALAAGADGYLSKDSDQAELTLAIEAVQRGETYLSPKVAGKLLRRGARAPGEPLSTCIQELTPREREVFQLLALGRSNKQVASALKVSLGTAKKHRENLQRKLNCRSTAEMALLAIREGLMESE
jgi:DNA-binding NarL/FixJ family response regulator